MTDVNNWEGEGGSVGPDGERGEKGQLGPPGEIGETGDQGEQGYKGDQGERGKTGDVGQTGSVGDRGDTGHQGYQGHMGVQGERGPKGDHGQTGEPGRAGSQGEPGKSSALTRNVTRSYLILLIVSVAAVLLLTHQVRQTNHLSRALCSAINDNRGVLRREHTVKLAQFERYLAKHPQGFGGITRDVILDSIRNERTILNEVQPVPCKRIS